MVTCTFLIWQERRARPRKGRPRRYVSGQYSTEKQSSSRYAARDERETIDFKQTVDALFAFHKSGFKPNARSYNVVMEDVCHFLKYGTTLHGEWFIDGQRVPLAYGRSHRQPLPPSMTERPVMKPDFQELARMEARTDGCPNQFDYGTNYHQTAEWRVKTAQWALTDAKAKRAEAEAALAAATAALEAAAAEAQPAAAAELEKRWAEASEVLAATIAATATTISSDGLAGAIIRAHTKLIEYHGKAGYDSLGYGPKLAISEAIESGAMLNPGTRELVTFLAKHRPSPSVAKADKSGWEAVDRYLYAFYDTSRFTKNAVPDATSFKGGQSHHRFIGLSEDRRKAEQDGPLRAVKQYCSCDPCLLLKTEDCLLQGLMGKAIRAQAPLAKGVPVRGPQMLSLEAFADSLEAAHLVSVCVDESEVELEGPYWLALLSASAFVLDEDTWHSGQLYRKGWIVVPGRWYKLQQRSERGYELQPEEERSSLLHAT